MQQQQPVCNLIIILLFFIFQIKNLKEAETYVFRVRAQNKAGVGKVSEVTEPVPALTKPGEEKKRQTADDKYPVSSLFQAVTLFFYGFQAPRR